ncbi:hypothetical protein LC605_25780 [Nostoc sp. CHAB 5836]|nr:hypothetical protein [Nostoc sp. CHAB 5836]MCC5618434.1 hypothetical protein [Nostoc sp. CHAB 5836]
MAEIFNECEKYGFEIVGDGIYNNPDCEELLDPNRKPRVSERAILTSLH